MTKFRLVQSRASYFTIELHGFSFIQDEQAKIPIESVLVARTRIKMLRRLRDEEQQREHAGAEDSKILNDVQVREHPGLAV